MSFIKTAGRAGGAAWALENGQSFPQSGKKWWKYSQQTADRVRQDLNQHPRAVMPLVWESLVHLHAGSVGFIRLHKEIWHPWVSGSCEPRQDCLEGVSGRLGLGTEHGQFYLCPCPAAPTADSLQVSLQRGSWLSELSFRLGYQCFAPMSERFLPEKCSQLYFLVFRWFMETLCLSSPAVSAGACPSCAYWALPPSLIRAAQMPWLKTGLH